MRGRITRTPCPECGQLFDARPDDRRAARWSSTRIGLAITAIVLMPFLAFVSIILLLVSAPGQSRYSASDSSTRVGYRTRRNQRRWKGLICFAFAEFFGLMTLSILRPEALNWW